MEAIIGDQANENGKFNSINDMRTDNNLGIDSLIINDEGSN